MQGLDVKKTSVRGEGVVKSVKRKSVRVYHPALPNGAFNKADGHISTGYSDLRSRHGKGDQSNDCGGGGDVTYLSPFGEGTARK